MPIAEAPFHPITLPRVTVKPSPPPVQPEYAGFWKRSGAFAVDMIIVFMLMIAWLSALNPVVGALESDGTIPLEWRASARQFLTTYIFLLNHWLYYSLMESSRNQATLGKLIWRIRVTDLEGRPVSFLRASARNLCKILSQLTYWIGFFMAGFSRRKQALHDFLAGCIVVNVPGPRDGHQRRIIGGAGPSDPVYY